MKRKLLLTLAAVFAVGTLNMQAVKAESLETLDTLGSTSKDVSIMYYDEVIYSVDINWSAMIFQYDRSGEWISPSTMALRSGNNYVEIKNNSNAAIKATMSFESAIDGVAGTFTHREMTEGNGTCRPLTATNGIGGVTMYKDETDDEGLYIWSYLGLNQIQVYEDATCETAYDPESYDSSKTYYVVSLEKTAVTEGNSATIARPMGKYGVSFTPVGAANNIDGKLLATTSLFRLNLAGGTRSNIKAAYNTESKKIGTVTLTLEDAE